MGENPRERTEMQERKRNKEENLPEIGEARNSNDKTCEKEQREREVSKLNVRSVSFGRGMRGVFIWVELGKKWKLH